LWKIGLLLAGLALWAGAAGAQAPDHPVLTEVYTDPPGANDGPVGRDPANLHQEYIELYLPPAADLRLGLNKDALRLTLFDVEGDSSSSGLGLINYRIDLPTYDLDPSNGITPGARPRPTSGIVVLGWVDYVGNPPTALAGTPSTRVGLIDGGITSATGFDFVAINGAQFGGTTNFPVPVVMSYINTAGSDVSSGKIENGSGVFLLVNRDDAGFVQRWGQGDPAHQPDVPNAQLNLGAPVPDLGVSSLLDAFAINDDADFDVLLQPYPSTATNVDLSAVLPLGGVYSLLAAQVPETQGGVPSNGYARLFIDFVKTTENGLVPDDPVADALGAYRPDTNLGPFYPTPGRSPFTSSPGELSLADASLQSFDVLVGTSGGPGLVAANVGGDLGLVATATPVAEVVPGAPLVAYTDTVGDDTVLQGQVEVNPGFSVVAPSSTPHGTLDVFTVDAAGDVTNPIHPPVVNPLVTTTATVQAVDPLTGQNAAALPFQATGFMALQGLPDVPGVPNEFVSTSLAGYVGDNLITPANPTASGAVVDERGNGAALLDPLTDLSNPLVIGPWEDEMPQNDLCVNLPGCYINFTGPVGRLDLFDTVNTSAEQTVKATYPDVNPTLRGVKAVRLNIAETRTSGGIFAPTERVHFADATGAVGQRDSGFTNALSGRGFEIALLDTNRRPNGTLELGATDDFGIVLKAGRVRAGSPVLSGEFIFMSLAGGLQGADLDSLDVPPYGNQAVIAYLDLDPLDSVLGVETVTQLFVVDAGAGGDVNMIEAFSLFVDGTTPIPEPSFYLLLASGVAGLGLLGRRRARA
jgi:hypothetical protein